MKKSCKSAKQEHPKICEDGRSRMKIQEASGEFTDGGIMFLGPKTSYLEANT